MSATIPVEVETLVLMALYPLMAFGWYTLGHERASYTGEEFPLGAVFLGVIALIVSAVLAMIMVIA